MIRACTRSRLKNPAGFMPGNLFAAGEQGAWYDPSDLSSLFQDNLGTVPVTAADQLVGMIRDKSGNGHHATQATGASKPILRNAGLLWYLEFDGVDDFLVTNTVDFTATSTMSLFTGLRKISDVNTGVAVELSATTVTNDGSFALFTPGSAGGNTYASRSKGTVISDQFVSPFIAPITNVVTLNLGIGTDTNIVRVNSVQAGSGIGDQGAGTFGNYPVYIGRRGGVSTPSQINLYGLIIRGATTDAATTVSTEKYMGMKSGIIL